MTLSGVVKICLLLLLPALASATVNAEPLRIAVASNFVHTLEQLIEDYRQHTEVDLVLSKGSSGKHYAQLQRGAPFDLFFSADDDFPQRLVDAGLASHCILYAYGQLVLWPTSEEISDPAQALGQFEYRRFAIANPRLAPYGRAAEQVLAFLGVAPSPEQLVKGENIAQAYQFIYTGNAQGGLVARSQMRTEDHYIPVPGHWHEPIRQAVVIMGSSRQPQAAAEFINYLATPAAERIITAGGYLIPPPTDHCGGQQ